jgi:hypothetical protein
MRSKVKDKVGFDKLYLACLNGQRKVMNKGLVVNSAYMMSRYEFAGYVEGLAMNYIQMYPYTILIND